MSTAFHSTFLAGVRTGRGAQDWQTGQEGEAWARQAPGESSSNPRTHDESLDVRKDVASEPLLGNRVVHAKFIFYFSSVSSLIKLLAFSFSGEGLTRCSGCKI